MIEQHQLFAPSEDMRQWVYDTFIEPGAPMFNEDHGHLLSGSLGFLWSNIELRKKNRMIIGRAELGLAGSDAWSKGRNQMQVEGWFGEIPDFIITIYAPWWQDASEPERCALVEHELYHCAQEVDEFGSPRFTQEGKPKFGIAGHDIEEFVGVVRRYGAVMKDVQEFVAAANAEPLFDGASVASLCGSCGK